LLPFHDALEEARRAVLKGTAGDPVRRGIELLVREWDRFLEREEVEPVAAVGELFHPEEEEAVGELPARPDRRDGLVAEVVQQGYRSPAGLLRPAKVLVARRPASPGAAAAAPPAPVEEARGDPPE
jgi:molecular chaperone GrpE (heat shock protein)